MVFAIIANSTLELILLETGILVLKEMGRWGRSYVSLAPGRSDLCHDGIQ